MSEQEAAPEGAEVSPAPNKGGRPPKLHPDEATLTTLTGLGEIQCTTKEASCVLRVSEKTFLKFLSDHDEAREAFEMGKGQGLHSLRRTQFKLAEKNAAMAIFLGKNYLGQTDKQEHQHSGPNGGPIQHVDLSGVSDEELARLEAILGPLVGDSEGGASEEGD